MSSPSVIVCHEVFDENSQPSAEEICEYAQQLGINPESESHLLPLAKDGLMQALPTPWKAYYDEKLQTHYYYNEDTKKTQWEHPLDNVYRDLVKKARDASMQDDTCASVQELLTSEEYTKHLERVETKVESDEELSTDSENHAADVRENLTNMPPKRLTPLGRPPLAPITRFDKKLGDLRVSPLRRSVDGAMAKPSPLRNPSDRELLHRPILERPKMLFKQQSEIIDMKMNILNSPEEESLKSLFAGARMERGLSLTGKGNMFLKLSKSDFPSPETEKSLTVDAMTKSDPPRGILREKISDILNKKTEYVTMSRPRQASSFDEDKKSVRFKLENVPEATLSPGSNSSSEQNEGQSSIISAGPARGSVPRDLRSASLSEKDSAESEIRERSASPKRRVLRPPAADYIKPDLFQKNFQKISDLVRPRDTETTSVHLEEPIVSEKEARPRSPMIPQKSKISINLMESIESETSIDSPDREFANIDLNDLDDSNYAQENASKEIDLEKNDQKVADINIDKEEFTNSIYKTTKSIDNNSISEISVPKIEFNTKSTTHSESEDSKKSSIKEDTCKGSKVSSDIVNIRSPQLKVSPTPSLGSELRSPRLDFGKPWSPLSTFKPLNRAVIAPQIKTSDSVSSLGRSLASPRLDGVILSQGNSSADNVVVVYQIETQEEAFHKPIKSPMIPDMGTRDFIERNKTDERRRLELSLQKELESIRVEWTARERKMRAELEEELRATEEKFATEKRVRLKELDERHKKEMEESLAKMELEYQCVTENAKTELEQNYRRETESMEKQHLESMARTRNEYSAKLHELRQQLELENDGALSELREQLQASLARDRTRMIEENRFTLESLREEHITRVTDLRNDYRAEVERLRAQHAWHLEEVRARGAGVAGVAGAGGPGAGGAGARDQRALADKYRCLKEKYARLKHDVKMSIERRNKRREMSMTTGSETERSNSHKANNQSLERCKEVNEVLTSAIVEPESNRVRSNNNPAGKHNDNETSQSDRPQDNNNEANWKLRMDNCPTLLSGDTSQASVSRSQHQQQQHQQQQRPRKSTVAFREPTARRRERERESAAYVTRFSPTNGRNGTTTDCQDSSDATTADDRPKESSNGRRRCFTRLKSASTSRLNYSPKRGEGWSSPLESLRQQLRKLDDLEDQFPDLACQPAYSLRYPFAELVVPGADSPELEFVRHRALVEREGMRRARAVLKRRRAALRETTATLSPHRAPSDCEMARCEEREIGQEEREATELEVALHRARALLGEKEIRLRHIERALRTLTDSHPPPYIQEATTSDASSGSSPVRGAEGGAGAGAEAGSAVLRSLRALHADVRDIWRALDARRPHTASPESSSCNAPTTSQTRLTLSAPEQPVIQDHSDGGVAERARGLRAWLQTAP